MAARIPAVWGIDLGQSALKAMRLEMKDGLVAATAFDYIEHPKILSQPDADPDELSREALNQFLSRNKIKGDLIAISVPGQSGLARFVKLPPVDEKKIADIVKFEAKQQIPFPLEEVVWDFQRLNKGDIIDGLALETEIGLFAMKRDMVTRAIRQFKEVNVEVHLVQMAPLALCNFLAYDLLGKGNDAPGDDGEDSNECVVALEIGTDNSNLVITNGGRIIWQRPIPIGGNHFTRALTKELKLTFAKAEHLKKNAAKSPDLKKILSSLKQVLNDFVGEVQRSLGYFTNTHRNAQIQYMVGLGNAFRLPGLQKFLQEKLQLEVRKFQSLERATGESVTSAPTFKENIMSFGVAYGLALQGLKEAKLQTNLLPYEVRLERVIRGKKPWAVAAAACLLFGMFMLAFARGMEKNAVTNAAVKGSKLKLENKVKDAKKLADDRKAAEDELKKHLDSLDQIGAGANERLNWQMLHQYVNLATPQPNGDRLPIEVALKPVKSLYWNKDAQDAFVTFEKQKLGQLKDKSPSDMTKIEHELKQNLIQINVAGINAMYSDDLLPFFAKIYADGSQLPGMTDEEKKVVKAYVDDKENEAKQKLLPKQGWVVEVRGYTYFKKGEKFVDDTIIANLNDPKYFIQKHPAFNDLKQRVQSRVSFLHLYKNVTEKSPVPGRFKIIGQSNLPVLVKGLTGGTGGGKPGGIGDGPNVGKIGGTPGQPGDQKEGEKKINRDGWRAIGEVASSIFVGGGGGGGGQPGLGNIPGGPDKSKGSKDFPSGNAPKGDTPGLANPNAVPRTEFVILFIWREPIASQEVIEFGTTEK
jgi:type IV pilus assembly protein PilM